MALGLLLNSPGGGGPVGAAAMEGKQRAGGQTSSGGPAAGAVEETQHPRGVAENIKGASDAENPEAGAEEEEQEEVDDNVDSSGAFAGFVPSPLVPLKHHIEKDKDDDSLRRWKEQLLGSLESYLTEQMEPEVIFHSIGVVSNGVEGIAVTLPIDHSRIERVLFTLKEGSHYQFKLTFTVKHNIASGLTYSNKVWKGGLRVDHCKRMLGTFAPQCEPYVHILDEETTPSGALARGVYSAKLKLVDDDRRCHMKLNYSFEIKKGS